MLKNYFLKEKIHFSIFCPYAVAMVTIGKQKCKNVRGFDILINEFLIIKCWLQYIIISFKLLISFFGKVSNAYSSSVLYYKLSRAERRGVH